MAATRRNLSTSLVPRAGRPSSEAPIAFSQTAAARTRITDTLGLPKEKENGTAAYVIIALGVGLCTALLYSCAVGSPRGSEWFAEPKTTAPPTSTAEAPSTDTAAAAPTAA